MDMNVDNKAILENQIVIMEALSYLVGDRPHIEKELMDRVVLTNALLNSIA